MGTNKILYLDKVFTATDVKSGNVYQARSPIAASQEIDTFSFDVYSEDTTLTEFIRNTPLQILSFTAGFLSRRGVKISRRCFLRLVLR